MEAKSKRPAPFDRKLERIRELRGGASPEGSAELAVLLGDKSHYIAAQAADAVRELELSALVPALVAAFQRVHDRHQPDQGCAVALATIRALEAMGADEPDAYMTALRMVRVEQYGASRIDVAVPVRIEATLALGRTRGGRAVLDIASRLGDDEPAVRAGVAGVLSTIGTNECVVALYVKMLAGDSDPEVTGACMAGLAKLDPTRFLPILDGYLQAEDDGLADFAAIAIGESNADGALAILRRASDAHGATRRGAALFLAIGLLRSDDALECLFEVAASGPDPCAAHAIRALAPHRHTDGIEERARAAVASRPSPKLASLRASRETRGALEGGALIVTLREALESAFPKRNE